MVRYCDTFSSQLPLSFILGFYVTYVAKRWWNQYLAIPWPDKYIVDLINICIYNRKNITDWLLNLFLRAMHTISLYVDGNDDYGRMIRRSLMRYMILTLILVLRSVSSKVKKRFPTLEHVVESGNRITQTYQLIERRALKRQ